MFFLIFKVQQEKIMKKPLLLILSFLIAFPLMGQDFTFEYLKGDNYIMFDIEDPSSFDVVLKGVIRNPSSEEITINWFRNVIHKNPEWETAVCDRNQCYLPFVSSQSVDIPANDTSNLDVHLYPDMVSGDSAVVEMSFVSSAAPNDTMTAIFRFIQMRPNSTERVSETEVTLYPNPTVDHFNIRSDRNIGSVVVYDLLGKEMLQKKAYGPQVRVQAGYLPKGVYIVRVLDEEGQVITTRRLRKDNL